MSMQEAKQLLFWPENWPFFTRFRQLPLTGGPDYPIFKVPAITSQQTISDS